ncbi:hypothetical protein [Canibacter oris]|uniref:Uncharacterized protein n=1 Tax=Canibacter oris TaxID=1365628 RepID=A0A840DG99_9MICO|nr:hypothetical protein [Canibacter oris]MBB4072064.1 hypothetical protein [Canibacter oris]
MSTLTAPVFDIFAAPVDPQPQQLQPAPAGAELLPYAYDDVHHVLPVYFGAAARRVRVGYSRSVVSYSVEDLTAALSLPADALSAYPADYYRHLADGMLETFWSYATAAGVVGVYAAADLKSKAEAFLHVCRTAADNWPRFMLSSKIPAVIRASVGLTELQRELDEARQARYSRFSRSDNHVLLGL